MRGMMNILIVVLLVGYVFSCDKPFNPPVLSSGNLNYLVVDGFIMPGTSTTIKLSRTLNISDSFRCERFEPVPNGIVIPSWVISALVHAPGGAKPSYAHGYYHRDNAFYREWDAIARDRDRFTRWMEEHVSDCVTV